MPDFAEGARALFDEAMPICPVCKQRIEGHRYRHIASTSLEEVKPNRLDAMLKAARCHRWGELAAFQEWVATSADADAYLLRCPDGRYFMAVIYCPYELEDIYKLLHQEQIEGHALPVNGGTWLQI
jgi:hypothetical protein